MKTLQNTRREQILSRACGVIRFRDGKPLLPRAFKNVRCNFGCDRRTTEQVLGVASRLKSGRIKPIAWVWVCEGHKNEIKTGIKFNPLNANTDTVKP